MSEAEDSRVVTILEARLQRLTEAIALATAEAFDEAIAYLGETEFDEVGIAEEALRMFFGELRDAKAQTHAAMGELKHANDALSERLDIIQRQEAAIRELSAPIIEIWRGVLSIPVIGALSAERASDMTERLLRRIVRSRARWVLLDMTGVADVDAATADHLLRLVRATQLIGCGCLVTGIGPRVAATLAHLDVDLRELRAARTLWDGLLYCLRQRQGAIE